MQDPHIYCDRKIIKCSVCGARDDYSFNNTAHFLLLLLQKASRIVNTTLLIALSVKNAIKWLETIRIYIFITK